MQSISKILSRRQLSIIVLVPSKTSNTINKSTSQLPDIGVDMINILRILGIKSGRSRNSKTKHENTSKEQRYKLSLKTSLLKKWLRELESNQRYRIQSPVS